MISINRILIGLILAFCCMQSVYAAESDQTQDTSEQTQNTAEGMTNDVALVQNQGEIEGYQKLNIADQEISATFLDDKTGDRHGVVIMLHDVEQGIDGESVISLLRHKLPESGWATMTVELDYPYEPNILLSASLETNAPKDNKDAEPETAKDTAQAPEVNNQEATTDDAGPSDETEKSSTTVSNQERLEAALTFINQKGISNIVLLGHGQGGQMAFQLLDVVKVPMIGLVFLGTPDIDTTIALEKMKLPILDVYGDRDEISVINASQLRKTTMKRSGNTNLFNRKLVGADHNFTGSEIQLTNTLRGWLKAQFVKEEND